jgi:hypothetical protein
MRTLLPLRKLISTSPGMPSPGDWVAPLPTDVSFDSAGSVFCFFFGRVYFFVGFLD